jgi:caa(3)-type oxidase subunit IV
MSNQSEHDHHAHSPWYYVKWWAILLGLLIISIIGPELGIKWVTLVTAFGIAIVKALIVAAYFMHLNIEKKYIHYMLYSMLLFVFMFFAGVAPDIMNREGRNWVNSSADKVIEDNADWQEQLKK